MHNTVGTHLSYITLYMLGQGLGVVVYLLGPFFSFEIFTT